MKQSRIYMQRWLGANERDKVASSDNWYLNFCNHLLPVLDKSVLFGKVSEDEKVNAAISYGLYFQDVISQSGGWKAFSKCYHKLYNNYLPFYKLTDEYVSDEINKEDISFITWTLTSRFKIYEEDIPVVQDPFNQALLQLSEDLYEVMDELFEQAPISEEPSSYIWVMGLDLLEMPNTPLPEIKPNMKLDKDVEKSLEYSNGKELLYFNTYDDLKKFFIDVLGWENKNENLLPELYEDNGFVVYPNAKGMLVGSNLASLFCDPNNPYYKPEEAENAYKLFIYPGSCPIDLLKLAVARNYFPQLGLPFPNGKTIMKNDWDFIARYFLFEYYEGN